MTDSERQRKQEIEEAGKKIDEAAKRIEESRRFEENRRVDNSSTYQPPTNFNYQQRSQNPDVEVHDLDKSETQYSRLQQNSLPQSSHKPWENPSSYQQVNKFDRDVNSSSSNIQQNQYAQPRAQAKSPMTNKQDDIVLKYSNPDNQNMDDDTFRKRGNQLDGVNSYHSDFAQ